MPTSPRSQTLRAAYGGGRITASRRRVAESVVAFGGAFTVDDLAARVRAVDASAGATATVYRAVAAMEESGFLARVGARDGHALFARCTADSHHHHIVCDGCGRIAHAECPLHVAPDVATTSGFVVTRHEVTMYGLCPECASRQGS